MPQPYNYSLNIASPMEQFVQGMQIGQAARAAEIQRQQQQAEADKQRRMSDTIAQLGPNATYADYAAAINANPDFAETLLSRWNTMSQANQNALFDAGARAWQFLTPDLEGNLDPTRAIAVLEERATAFENSGQTDIAQQLRDSARAMQMNPAAANSTLGLMLAATNPDRFKTLSESTSGAQEYTTFQQDLVAANIDPNSPEGIELSRQFVQGRVDPIVEMPTPDGLGIFRGPFSEYRRRYGNANSANAAAGDSSVPSGSPLSPIHPELAGIPQRAIDYLITHPETAPQFDERAGQPGLAARILRGEL